MDNKEKNLQDIVNCGVVAIIRVASAQEAVEVCGAIAKGGASRSGLLSLPGRRLMPRVVANLWHEHRRH